MPLSKAALITSIACGSIVLIIGITCLVLGLQGYFTFKDPCMTMKSFEMVNLQLDSSDSTPKEEENGGGGSGGILGFINSATGGLLDEIAPPTQVEMTMALVLEVNNTNPFDLGYEQDGEGKIFIPANEITGLSEDVEVGDWSIPKGTLKGNAVNEIPVAMNAILDLANSETTVLAISFVKGGPISFQVSGGIKGDGWVPGLSGENTFVCLARMENVLAIGQGAKIRCKHSTKVGFRKRRRRTNEVIEEWDESFTEVNAVDPKCYV